MTTHANLAPPENETQLEEYLSRPGAATIELMRQMEGDILILGAGGKMGPTLSLLAANACREAGVPKQIIAVSRYSDTEARERLEKRGVSTISCDLADNEAVRRLPDAPNVIFMAGRKFGEIGTEAQTWIMNVVVPANVAQRYSSSRIVCFSTGCVYPLLPPDHSGSTEKDAPAPVGEYASSCLGRERVFEHYSRTNGTPVLIYRLNYAIDLRYGVLNDIATRVASGQPVDISVPFVNVIWQGDANNRALLCLQHATSPPRTLNVTGEGKVSVEWVARELAQRMGKDVRFTEKEGELQKAYLSDATESMRLFGRPEISIETMLDWTAHWVMQGGKMLNKPTHFTVTDGQFLDAKQGKEIK